MSLRIPFSVLWLVVSVFCTYSGHPERRPPEIQPVDGSTQLEFIKEFLFPDAVIITSADASVVDNRLPDGYGPDCRGKDEALSVRGSFDCLNGFWALLRSVVDPSRITYRNYVESSLGMMNCDYSIGFKECLNTDGSTSSLQAVTSDVRAVSDGDSSTVWARKITPGYDTTIMFTFRKPVKIISISIQYETLPIDITVSIANRTTPRTFVQRQSCNNPSNDVCERSLQGQFMIVDIATDVPYTERVYITLHSVKTAGPYQTDYIVIRDIDFLVLPKSMPEPTTTTTTTTTTSTTTTSTTTTSTTTAPTTTTTTLLHASQPWRSAPQPWAPYDAASRSNSAPISAPVGAPFSAPIISGPFPGRGRYQRPLTGQDLKRMMRRNAQLVREMMSTANNTESEQY